MNKELQKILAKYCEFPQVQAIAIGGSAAASTSDVASDIDVYVFVNSDIPISDRLNLVKTYSSSYEVGGEYFGSGDEFFVDVIQKQLDVMFWNVNWFNDTVENVWTKHFPSNGYSTAFLYTLKNFQIIFDKNNWLKNLQNKMDSKYPQQLQQNIINRNIMLLKDKPFASYYEQIEKAINRQDINSVNHRVSAFLASYFDIIFAINELLHPGEKRLVQYAKNNCKILPKGFETNIEELLTVKNTRILTVLDKIIVNLKQII